MKTIETIHKKKIVFYQNKGEVLIENEDKTSDIYKAKFGKHAIWIPEIQMKIVWSWRGKICSWKDWDKGSDAIDINNLSWNDENDGWDEISLISIANEIEIMKLLSVSNMAPEVGRLFHFDHAVSDFPFGDIQCDSMGVFGYEILDASRLPMGRFEVQEFRRRFVESGMIKASEGALGDVAKPDNCVNGYLVDVRRTGWDMMMLKKPNLEIHNPNAGTDTEALKLRIKKLTQFPYGARKENYQSYWLEGENQQSGSRDTLARLKLMGLNKDHFFDSTVLDIGCNLGSICIESCIQGARYACGVDFESDYIDCARDLAKHNDCKANYMQMDLECSDYAVEYFNKIFPQGVDILFALSVYKHIGNHLWTILRGTNWKVAYVESHNAPNGVETDHVKEMIRGMESLGVKFGLVCVTTDRSPRLVWRLEK